MFGALVSSLITSIDGECALWYRDMLSSGEQSEGGEPPEPSSSGLGVLLVGLGGATIELRSTLIDWISIGSVSGGTPRVFSPLDADATTDGRNNKSSRESPLASAACNGSSSIVVGEAKRQRRSDGKGEAHKENTHKKETEIE